MDVKTFPLIGGQELVVDLVNVGEDFIVVKTPMVFQTVRHPETGEVIHGFGDWPALAKVDPNRLQRIPISSVLGMPTDAHEEVERSYRANISGLELPPVQPKILLS